MMTHTPGPWHRNIPPAWKYPVIFAGRNTHVAALARSSNREDAEGNINLIAAAPELLEALEILQGFADVSSVKTVWSQAGEQSAFNKALNMTRKAIAKARGA